MIILGYQINNELNSPPIPQSIGRILEVFQSWTILQSDPKGEIPADMKAEKCSKVRS